MASMPKCRGFTHPVLLLIRSSVRPGVKPPRPFFSSGRLASSPVSLSPAPSRLTVRLLATSRTGPTPAVRTGAPRAAAVPRPSAGSGSYAQLLAQAKHGAVLYEAAPQKVFLASSYAAALFCVGGGVVNLYFNVYNPPAGTADWIPYAFSAVALMLSILGMNFALMPANVVRIIKVLPSAAKAAATTGEASSKAAYAPPAKVRLEVALRRLSPLPGLPLKRLQVEPHEIVLKTRLYQPKAEPTAMEKLRMGAEWERRRKAQRDYDDNHRMTLPFRDLAWALGQIFTSLRRGLTGEGFAEIEVRGKKYKIDQSNAYVLEDGRALDRLVRIEQSTAASSAA